MDLPPHPTPISLVGPWRLIWCRAVEDRTTLEVTRVDRFYWYRTLQSKFHHERWNRRLLFPKQRRAGSYVDNRNDMRCTVGIIASGPRIQGVLRFWPRGKQVLSPTEILMRGIDKDQKLCRSELEGSSSVGLPSKSSWSAPLGWDLTG